MKTLLNIVLMQAAWFACVLGAANGLPWLGVIVAVAVSAWHLATATRPRSEAMLLGASLVIGFLFDSALATASSISFASGVIVKGLTTVWMLGLWLSFATVLTSSLRWLLSRPPLAILFGAIGGPMAYWSGAKLGAITLGPTPGSVIAIGVCWALAMGIFILLTRHVSRVSALELPT